MKKKKEIIRKVKVSSTKELVDLIYFDSPFKEHEYYAVYKIKKMYTDEFNHFVEYSKSFLERYNRKISWTLISSYIDRYRRNNMFMNF